MRMFEEFIKERYNITMPHGNISGAWFSENGFPMVVQCTCCGMTMASPSALIDDEGYTFCTTCGEEN